MNKMYKGFITALVLMVSMGATTAHAEGTVHKAVNKVSGFAYEVIQKDEKWVEKTASKIVHEAEGGVEALEHWCGEHKETCAKNIMDMAKGIVEDADKIAEIVGEELVEEAPEIVEACVLILGSL